MNDSRESHPVRKTVANIVQSQAITADQVRELEKFVAQDWVIDQDEAHLLFRINQAIGSEDEDCPEWTKFFVRSINRLVVMDLNTPGQIDESEGNWLGSILEEYSVGNETETKLLFDLRNTTTSIAGSLSEKIQSFD